MMHRPILPKTYLVNEMKKAAVVTIIVMALVGVVIASVISEKVDDGAERYYTAITIDSKDLFEYGMRTNAGYAFVYGDYKAVDPVGFDEISGEFSSVKKVEEHYNMHTRLVTKSKTVNGKTVTYTETETYYSWDYAGEEEKSCEKIIFCGVEFAADKIQMPQQIKIQTIKQSQRVRFIYYASLAETSGSIFTRLENGTIENQSVLVEGKMPREAKTELLNREKRIVYFFWIAWTILTAVACNLSEDFWDRLG